MVRKDKRSDLKLGIPFLNSENIPEIPSASIIVEIFTAETKKVIAKVLYNPTSGERSYVGCFFKEVQYTDIEGLKPILVIPIDSPNFTSGRLNCNITIIKQDLDFPDNEQKIVQTLKTNIEIL